MKFLFFIVIATTMLYGIKIYSQSKNNNDTLPKKEESLKTPEKLYKILSLNQWEDSKKNTQLTLPKNDADFIHFSTAKQVDYVINKYYKDTPYVLLTIDPKKVPGTFKLELNSKGTDKFYHAYDSYIPHEAIIENSMHTQSAKND